MMGQDFGNRSDGTPKGNGFLGVFQRPDGRVSSEISVGVDLNGKETEIPTLVPTLSNTERNWLINNDVSDPARIPRAILDKAVTFARQRIASGQSLFAQPSESPAGGQIPVGAGLLGTSRRPVDADNLQVAMRTLVMQRLSGTQ